MLNNISWQDYLGIMGAATILYYIIIGLTYFRNDLKKALNRKRGNSRQTFVYEDTGDTGPLAMAMEVREPIEVGNEIDLIEDLAEKLGNTLSGKTNPNKHELGEYIGQLFRDYPTLKTSGLRESISELVVSECEKNGIGFLSKSEVDQLW
ncbi:hypothetical protein [Flavobacterium lindanitolerans]|uniref:hypothetical protein n=1 Tax=Flavobacterium lindanitolerans TaxID=428988 RepID=UPI0027B97505|nr:hypothetical protein [Flavobacterium lindanitolerans]